MSGLENLLAGKTLVKRYRIEEVIGLGGFAAVYRAVDERLGRDVAVKVITLAPPDPGMRERLRQRFEREARAAAALPHHPNVITVHDFGSDPELGLQFLVMEMLRGENLAQLFKRQGRMGMDVGLQVLREAAEGVAVGHAAGIIHRDVKPGNIFLAEAHDDDPFRVVVLDFGIARVATDDAELTRTFAGENPLTAAYAAPEQMRGEHHLTPAADVFSLGVVGYQILTGEKPFAGGEGRRLRGREPVRPIREFAPQVPPAVEMVIERAMAEDPAARYPDAAAFCEALSQAMQSDDRTILAPAGLAVAGVPDDATVAFTPSQSPPAVAAPPVAPAPPVREPVAAAAPASPRVAPVSGGRRSRAPALLLGLLLLAGIVAAAFWAMNRGGGGEATAATRDTTSVPATTPRDGGEGDETATGGPTLPPSAPGTGTDADNGTDARGGDTDNGTAPGDNEQPSSPAPPTPPAGIAPTPGIAPEPEPSSPISPPVVSPPSAPPVRPSPPPAAPPSEPPAQPRPQPRPQPAPPSAPPSAPPAAPPPAPPPSPPPAPPPVIVVPPPAPVVPAPNPNAPRDTIVIPTSPAGDSTG
ncbi:MAG TPA: serine/threonine-protein kinase [Longimicrobium sp.]|nr:serine/threonine-protein kinase [Longimicrobium sp.]